VQATIGNSVDSACSNQIMSATSGTTGTTYYANIVHGIQYYVAKNQMLQSEGEALLSTIDSVKKRIDENPSMVTNLVMRDRVRRVIRYDTV
jgi:hypothetical protein